MSIVERSTTGADWVDEVETGWTEGHAAALERTTKTNAAFRSRLPLQENS
jgi:hypothetical protein